MLVSSLREHVFVYWLSLRTFAIMKIGNISFDAHPLFLAPMEDVTDIGFRLLCKRFGAAMVYTEFVSAEALVRSVKSTVSKLTISCPVKRVAGKGAGAGMLRNVQLMLEITREVVRAVRTPVTVKTRLGWNCEEIIIPTLAEQLQDCGIAALTIHGRTRSQMYTGEANWRYIGEVKANPRIHIPIIGNGDICTPQQAKEVFDRYGVDAVMVGRATFGRPWVFKEMKDHLEGLPQDPSLTLDRKIDLLEEQLRINIERIDEYRGILHTRRHLAASPIFKGIPDFKQTRIAMLRADKQEELIAILEGCRERLRGLEQTVG